MCSALLCCCSTLIVDESSTVHMRIHPLHLKFIVCVRRPRRHKMIFLVNASMRAHAVKQYQNNYMNSDVISVYLHPRLRRHIWIEFLSCFLRSVEQFHNARIEACCCRRTTHWHLSKYSTCEIVFCLILLSEVKSSPRSHQYSGGYKLNLVLKRAANTNPHSNKQYLK